MQAPEDATTFFDRVTQKEPLVPQPSLLLIENRTRQTVLCPRARVADTTLTRLFGLLGKRPLAQEEGLLIQPSSGVHTWGMTFAIDIVAIDRNHHVLGAWPSIGPWRVRGLGLKTRSILELAPGAIERSHTMVGDCLHLAAIPA